MSQILDRVLTAARQLGASDVHLKAGLPPMFRIKGDLRTVRDVPALTREVIARFAVHMMNDRQHADFEQHLDIDLACGAPDGVRYRVQEGLHPHGMMTFDQSLAGLVKQRFHHRSTRQ